MGGLISLYAICEYPKVFGGAACLSTHWPVVFTKENNLFPQAINKYLLSHLPSSKTHKIYFDLGNQTLDSMYKPYQNVIDVTMRQKGFDHRNWITKEFKGQDHSEKSWAGRFAIPVEFLLSREMH
jgi:enterochelin esterase-like enzyme